MAREIRVELGDCAYPILVGRGVLGELGFRLTSLGLSRKIMVVSNPTVWDLYGATVENSLQAAGFEPAAALVEDGEEHKTLTTASTLYDRAMEGGLDRKSAIVALGGGVIGDMAGFVAATFMRGVPFVQVPTTLLAQVDSSVGGKVAVNHPLGKNTIGAFYQPKLVLADLEALKTLPRREVQTGLAEIIKYGVIRDRDFFAYCDDHMEKALDLDLDVLEQMVCRSCEIKAEVVAADEREENLRAILNFGHTFGHGIETLTDYKTYRHGEAVAMGMAAAGRLACRLALWKEKDLQALLRVIAKAGLPLAFPPYPQDRWVAAMARDKKALDGKLTFILPRSIGEVEILKGVEPKEYLAAIAETTESFSTEG